jgi:monothiol glutaredoxin
MSDEDKISLPLAGDEEQESDDEKVEDSDEKTETERDGVLGKIEREVGENEVVLYMKGSPDEPMCGFSARASQLLAAYGVSYKAVDVLTESDKREGIKEFGDWPTIPQLYVGGELVGGSDIVMEMHESGELADLFDDEGIEFSAP